ncbi:MAG: gas vesicle protein [Proteobacteria bacterium]|nr:gas vesicle protein [Pseudomonadota bacterium]MBU1585163.1 gas vesicle protein [Pseudomonadota bacterium]MBU2454476.1 gas vesicle protein [Pseudomonadota bacterium]MBU2629053.1 gas vesicle protein [Pseudomonadota bacterium]
MEPRSYTKATLVDLLDRVLDKGIVIHAEIVISVAGIPLIGVNLKAALAGMETMLEYGMMEELDKRIRSRALEDEKKNLIKDNKEYLWEEQSV